MIMGIRYIGECRICNITCSNMDASLLCHRCWPDPDAARRRHAKFVGVTWLLWLFIISLIVISIVIGNRLDKQRALHPITLEKVDNR